MRTTFAATAAALAALLAWVVLGPADRSVEHSIFVAAKPDDVYAHVNDLSRWPAWSPWAKRDPAVTISFLGPRSGPGAILRWDGNDAVGRGAVAITEARPGAALRIRLDRVRPVEDTSDVGLTFAPEGSGTRVTWTHTGRRGSADRLAVVLAGGAEHDAGADGAAGLAALKAVVEAAPPRAPVPAEPEPAAPEPVQPEPPGGASSPG